MPTIVVLGGDTAVGRATVELLEEREIEAEVRAAALTERIGPGLVTIDEALIGAGDVFVLALEGKMADGILEGLRRANKPVLDVREAPSADSAWIWPGLDPEAGAGLTGVARIALGLPSAIVAVAAALGALGPRRIFAATYESAARYGQVGMDELSAQVRGVFTMQTPDPDRLPASLAFDVIPSLADRDEDPEVAELDFEAAITAGLEAVGLGTVEVAAARALVPSFSAEAAFLDVELEGDADADAIEAALAAGRTLRRSDEALLPSLDAVGRDDVLVGRVRVDGAHARLWLASDRLRRGSATLVALTLERWLEGAADTMSKPAQTP